MASASEDNTARLWRTDGICLQVQHPTFLHCHDYTCDTMAGAVVESRVVKVPFCSVKVQQHLQVLCCRCWSTPPVCGTWHSCQMAT